MLSHSSRRLRASGSRFARTCHFERLDRRDMLTAGLPTVVGVQVAGTAWDTDFYDYLQSAGMGAGGYSIPVGSTAQAKTLSWTNIDQIKVTFSEDVNVDAADLSLSGKNTTSYHFSDFHYDPQTRVATWTLAAPLTKDRLRIDLDANGIAPVEDLEETILDGEWTNNSDTFPSGNGTAGGDFEFNFNVLPGDVNNSSTVTYYDYLYVKQLNGKSTASPGYNAIRDLDGSGLINAADQQAALDRVLDQLPSGSPAGANNDAPTTSGFALVDIDDDTIDVAISLYSHFGDAENGASGLAYSIVSNDNAPLFDAAYINAATGELVLNAASGASGRATLIVRGTDSGGLTVDTAITVDVDYENQAPAILNFYCGYVGEDVWIVTGDVSDADDDVTGLLVRLTGAVETRVAVDDQGHFEVFVTVDPEAWGWEFAVVYDPHGLASDVESGYIGIT